MSLFVATPDDQDVEFYNLNCGSVVQPRKFGRA